MNNKQRMGLVEVAQAIVIDRFALEVARRIREQVDLRTSWKEHVARVISFVQAQLPLSIHPYPEAETKTRERWEGYVAVYVQLRYNQILETFFIGLEDPTSKNMSSDQLKFDFDKMIDGRQIWFN